MTMNNGTNDDHLFYTQYRFYRNTDSTKKLKLYEEIDWKSQNTWDLTQTDTANTNWMHFFRTANKCRTDFIGKLKIS